MNRVIPITTPARLAGDPLPALPDRFGPVRLSRPVSVDRAAGPAAPGGELTHALRLSIEVDILAESLYHAVALVNASPTPELRFNELPAKVRIAYRDAATIALQRLVPTAHESALRLAEGLAPNFSAALSFYLDSLLRAPAIVTRVTERITE